MIDKDDIKGWNDCIHTLYAANIISVKDLVDVWKTTTPQRKQDEYFNGS